MTSKNIYDNEKKVLRERNLELNTMISELEDKNTQLLLEDQKYIKLMNQVLDNIHLEYVWRAVKQVLRDINVTSDFTDNDYKKIMERACRILTEDKRDILKQQAWNNFLLFFNEKNKIGAEIKNINCVLKNTRVVMNNDVYKELYRYFTAAKSPTVYHWNKDVRNKALNLLDNESTYPNEKKRKSISNKLRNMRYKTRNFLKNKGNETRKFLKKKRNQTRNFFKNKRQNITQKVGKLRKRLFGKKNNRETSKHPPPPPPRSGRIVPDSEIKFNNYVNFSKNNEYGNSSNNNNENGNSSNNNNENGNSSNNNNENNNPENTTTLTF